jgi:hypothetical protein
MLNSFLLAVCLAVMGQVVHKAADNDETLAVLRVSLETAKEVSTKTEKVNAEALARIERKLDEMLPRPEFDARVSRDGIRVTHDWTFGSSPLSTARCSRLRRGVNSFLKHFPASSHVWMRVAMRISAGDDCHDL